MVNTSNSVCISYFYRHNPASFSLSFSTEFYFINVKKYFYSLDKIWKMCTITRFNFTLSFLKYQKFFLLAETVARIKYKSWRILAMLILT